MTHITDPLRVYSCARPRVRYGRGNDGGYLAFDLPVPYDAFLSGGIEHDNSFELAILGRNPELCCEAFDPVDTGNWTKHERFHFHPGTVPLHPIALARNALVKLDIEGDEWPWLAFAPLGQVAQLVVELHSPHLERWNWGTLARLASSHALVHAHGNNWDGIVEIEGVRVPGTLETTWIRRDLAGQLMFNREPFPGPLDMPNDPSKPDHTINWPPFVEVP